MNKQMVKNLKPFQTIRTSAGMTGKVVRVHVGESLTSVVLLVGSMQTEWQTPSLTDVEVL